MLVTESMPMKQGVSLAHALCQAIADEAGVRALFLKGPVAGQQGLRSPDHPSGDVDMLCLPADRPVMEAGLRARGWRLRPVSTAAREFTTHSLTFIHDSWPCDIDLHTSFPGMLADSATAFEALWSHREEHPFAGVPAMTPDRSAQFLILLLHGLRSPDLARNTQEIAAARVLYRNGLSDDERATLRRLVAVTGAAEPTQEFFAGVGDPVEVPARPSAAYAMWQLKTGPSRTESWLLLAMHTRGAARVRVLFRAALPSRADMYADHPESADGLPQLVAAHGRRLTRAARLTPRAIRQIARARRAVRAAQPATTAQRGPGDPTDATAEPRSPQARGRHSPPVVAPHASVWTDDQQILFVLPLHSTTSKVMALRGTAADLWTLLQDAGTTTDELASAACAHWEIPADTVRADVEAFLAQLVDWGALVAA